MELNSILITARLGYNTLCPQPNASDNRPIYWGRGGRRMFYGYTYICFWTRIR